MQGMKALCKATVDMGAASRSMARANLSAASNLSSTLETDKGERAHGYDVRAAVLHAHHAQYL